MADSILKIKPIKDLIDEVLDTVEPLITYQVGEKTLEFWKPEHIKEKHHLRFVAIQVKQMFVSRQYTNLLDEINALSERTDTDANLQGEANRLTHEIAQKLEELLPLNCQYLEALSELEPDELLNSIKAGLAKRGNRKKDIPLALFVNTLASKVREAMAPVEEEDLAALAALEPSEDKESSPLEVTAEAETITEPLAPTNNAKQLATTS